MMNTIFLSLFITSQLYFIRGEWFTHEDAELHFQGISDHLRAKRDVRNLVNNASLADLNMTGRLPVNFTNSLNDINITGLFENVTNSLEQIFSNQSFIDSFTEIMTNALLGKCSMDCVQQLETDGTFNKSEFGLDMAPKVMKQFEPGELDKLCNSYIPHSQCLHNCSVDEPLRNLTLLGFKFIETICISDYEDMKIYGACLDKFGNKSEEACKNKCKEPFLSSADQLINFNTTNFNDAQLIKINKTFIDTCEAASCNVECAKPILIENCGQPSLALVKKIGSSLLESATGLVKLHSMYNDNVTLPWSQPCQPFKE